jgi:dynein heavy chain
LISPEGESVKLVNGVSTRFNIEMWLNNLQKEMIETMKRVVRDGNKDFVNAVQKTRVQWILNHKSQAVLTDNQIIWTNETQEAIREQSYKRDSLTQWYELLLKQLNQLTELIRTDLKPLYHKIAVALITADVHNRDIISNLINIEV